MQNSFICLSSSIFKWSGGEIIFYPGNFQKAQILFVRAEGRERCLGSELLPGQ